MTNVEKLHQYGLLPDPDRLASDQRAAINDMDPAEIDALIEAIGNMGDVRDKLYPAGYIL